MLMLERLGLPYYYVKAAESDLLLDKIEKLILVKNKERERLFDVKAAAYRKYFEVFSSSSIS